MIKFFAFNILAALFLTSCSHSGHHSSHHSSEKNKPCKIGEKCDETKKESGCCEQKESPEAKKESCCKKD
jgi:hypothetical protein